MPYLKNLDNRYIAGLFDGEGWFHINKSIRKDTRRPESFQVYAAICMKSRYIIECLQHQFGGSISITKATKTHATYYKWTVVGEGVLSLVKKIGPYLLIKQEQAELAKDFQEFKSLNKNRPNSDARHAKLYNFYRNMKQLNHRGPNG